MTMRCAAVRQVSSSPAHAKRLFHHARAERLIAWNVATPRACHVAWAREMQDMTRFTLKVNGAEQTVDVDDRTPLLWVLRNDLALTGTKFGCGLSQCGACTVHLDGKPVRSCVTPVNKVGDQAITTIEGLAQDGSLHPLQEAWIEAQAPQCGYCQSGQIMSAAALLEANPDPTDAEITEAMAGNLCRCGTYNRIRQAIKLAARNEA